MSKCPWCPNVHDVVTLNTCGHTCHMKSYLSPVVTLVTFGHMCHTTLIKVRNQCFQCWPKSEFVGWTRDKANVKTCSAAGKNWTLKRYIANWTIIRARYECIWLMDSTYIVFQTLFETLLCPLLAQIKADIEAESLILPQELWDHPPSPNDISFVVLLLITFRV